MKKHVFLAMLMAVSLVQLRAQEVESEDSTVSVIGWFCPTDTLEYSISTTVEEIADGDSTVTEWTWNEFRICVKDSTKHGFTMEYVPTAMEMSDSTSAQGRLTLEAARMALGNRVMFSTDEMGVFKEITNLKEVYQNTLAVQQRLVDKLYEENPALYAKVSKPDMLKQMKERTHNLFGSKEGAAENFMALKMLFLNHGRQLPVGERELDTEVGKTYYIISTGAEEGEPNPTEGEYQIYYEVETPETDGVKTTNYYDYAYFGDGWPRRAMMTIKEDEGGKTTLTQVKIEWKSKSW